MVSDQSDLAADGALRGAPEAEDDQGRQCHRHPGDDAEPGLRRAELGARPSASNRSSSRARRSCSSSFATKPGADHLWGRPFSLRRSAERRAVVLDFNRAYSPPCAFTAFATCPLPPRRTGCRCRSRRGSKALRGDARGGLMRSPPRARARGADTAPPRARARGAERSPPHGPPTELWVGAGAGKPAPLGSLAPARCARSDSSFGKIRIDCGGAGEVIDPICGMTVEPATAAGSREHAGTTYYFCSTYCRDLFKSDPGRFLAAAVSPPSVGGTGASGGAAAPAPVRPARPGPARCTRRSCATRPGAARSAAWRSSRATVTRATSDEPGARRHDAPVLGERSR